MIDDFGSGYSNLSRLSELPIDVVKIDKSLLWGDTLLFNSVLQMIKNLGFTTIIEGVETSGHVQQIEMIGTDMMQGYFFGHPQPTDHDWSKFVSPRIPAPLDPIVPSTVEDEFTNPIFISGSDNPTDFLDSPESIG